MDDKIHGITVNYFRDGLFDDLGIKRLKESYMRDDESSPQERFAYVSAEFGSNPEHSQRLYDYSSNHWLSYSTPILSFGRSKRGLPISCFLPYLDDSAEGLVDTLSEVNWLSMLGGGIGIGIGIRSADDKSVGVMPHLRTYDASSLAYRQGRTRRGSYAAYLDISHPDILMFLDMRKPTGDPNMRALNLHHGINVSDDFMEIIERCMIEQAVLEKMQTLDSDRKQQVLDFVEFLQYRGSQSLSDSEVQFLPPQIEKSDTLETSFLEAAHKFIGCLEGPGDLSTNPKYMDGYGQS